MTLVSLRCGSDWKVRAMKEAMASRRSQAQLPGFLAAPPAKTGRVHCQCLPEAQDKSQTLWGRGAAVGPTGSCIRDGAGLECAVRGQVFPLCLRAGEKLVIKCHIQWGLRRRLAGGLGFVGASFLHLTPASWSALF